MIDGRGVYVHVPFCVRKCFYCDFNSYSLDRAAVDAYLKAIDQEIALYERALARRDDLLFDSLYIGGGTPTCLSGKDLAWLVRRLLGAFRFREGAEVTCEANPGSSNWEKFARMKEAGVNRLSIGVQSLDDALLLRIGRNHTAADVYETVDEARKAGFDNVNLDLMFALPGQSLKQWEETVRGVISLGPEHLSCYSLIIEDGTPFGDAFAVGKLSLPGEDAEYEMFEWVIGALKDAGYEHYEVSNFSLPGRRSVHNQIYWKSGRWLGLGPGAHGFWRRRRYANLRPPAQYNAALKEGRLPLESARFVSRDEEMDDVMIFGLRLLDGVTSDRFRERFGVSPRDIYRDAIDRLVDGGLLEATAERIRLTDRGLFVANHVFAEFLRS